MALVLGIDRHILKTGYLQPGYLANICHYLSFTTLKKKERHTKNLIDRFGVDTFLGALQIRGQLFLSGFPCLVLYIGEFDWHTRFLSAQISG